MAPSVLSHLFPRQGVQLGRLVTNMKAPQDNYWPSGTIKYLKNDVYSISGRDFLDLHQKAQDTKLKAVLTSALSALYHGRKVLDSEIANTICITYFLDNSDGKFEKMCKERAAREWFERAYRKRKHIYMVVSIQTITEATLELKGDTKTTAEVSGTLPTSNLATAGGVPISADAGNLKLTVEHLTSRHRETGFVAEGEQIYAIQYRKVKFELLSSGDIDHAHLEEGNRWKVMWQTMGTHKEGNDVLQVTLEDTFDVSKDLDKDISSCEVEGEKIFYVELLED